MPDFSVFLPILSITIALLAAIGVVIAFLGNKNRSLSEVQASTITALQAQNDAQEQQITMLEKEIARCKRDGVAMRAGFKQVGIEISEINEREIILIQTAGASAKRTRIIQLPIEKEA